MTTFTNHATITFPPRPAAVYTWVVCADCDGDEGWWDDHDDRWVDCLTCGGAGGWSDVWQGDAPDAPPPPPCSLTSPIVHLCDEVRLAETVAIQVGETLVWGGTLTFSID